MRLVSPLMPSTATSTSSTAMVILNTPISKPPSALLEQLWDSSSFRICADGGANRLYHATAGSQKYVPHVIRGDLDSLQSHVREYYAAQGVSIEQDPCQDTNDLDKALQRVALQEIQQVVIYGAFGGRFDQEMASFQALYKWAPAFQNRIWLYSDETSAVLIPAETVVEVQVPFTPAASIREGPTCGLIPMGVKCNGIWIKLPWNLVDWCPHRIVFLATVKDASRWKPRILSFLRQKLSWSIMIQRNHPHHHDHSHSTTLSSFVENKTDNSSPP